MSPLVCRYRITPLPLLPSTSASQSGARAMWAAALLSALLLVCYFLTHPSVFAVLTGALLCGDAPLLPRRLSEAAPPPSPHSSGAHLPHLRDLIFGVVAFHRSTRSRAPYHEGVRRWVLSVRRHTDAARSELVLFTGRGEDSLAADRRMGRWLAAARATLVEEDYDDDASTVAHGNPKRFVWCVMRNRWFAIARYLTPRAALYRYVLMSDTRDALLQAPPFAWRLDGAVAFSGEGSGKVRTLRQSKKGLPRTLMCARGASAADRRALLDTEPLNAGVTVGDAAAFLNFSLAMTRVIRRVTTEECVQVKDCTDQGLYNLLVYVYWRDELPYTRKLVLPMEKAFSYTLGHKQPCCTVDAAGRILNDAGHAPPVVHQYAKGIAGRVLPRTRFWEKISANTWRSSERLLLGQRAS